MYTFEALFNPLCQHKVINLKFVKWFGDSNEEEEEFDGEASKIKLIALILQANGGSPSKSFMEASGLDVALKNLVPKVEDLKELCDQIKSEINKD